MMMMEGKKVGAEGPRERKEERKSSSVYIGDVVHQLVPSGHRLPSKTAVQVYVRLADTGMYAQWTNIKTVLEVQAVVRSR